MNGPDLRYVRRPESAVVPAEAAPSARALELAVEIERLLERAHTEAVERGDETYSVRLAQAICSSLVGELSGIAAGSPRSQRRIAR